ncbi:MAG: tRNA uridine-5-carboxymethylaminomethyl(34) synthesis GTPase MnmE [Omnitrophica bacterium RBG_13_46_9]|nr:MAG: tRNA uridine-5-carboxymethylaminomethyl(34) synthesis GTPase MnmE [Omnitrophica bacterium RBG_13_46_9]
MQRENILYDTEDTIVAISTPVGQGGIGIVRLSGKKALSIADRIFVSKDKNKPSGFKTYTTHYGQVVLPAGPRATANDPKNEVIDEVILTVMRAPKSYTKEDIVEINCHGGIVPLRRVLDLVLSLGARIAQPGEFTKRAFINGRIDLTQAEAVLDIIRSKTESSMKAAVCQLEGELSKKIRNIREMLLNILGEIEAGIDFSEEDIELAPKHQILRKLTEISEEVKKLIDGAWKGIILREGIMCVICGKPNVGKSSLMNAVLRRNRVIVTPVPGTTRDAIEEEINLEGIPVRVVDTAGISRAKNVVEEHGIRKSISYIKIADIILFMLDLSRPWSREDKDIFNGIKGKDFITIANKSDLPKRLNLDKVREITGADRILEISLLQKKNLAQVEEAILRKVWRGEILHPEGAFVTNARHKKELENAHKQIRQAINALHKDRDFLPEIAASELKEAVFFLGSILGDTIEPDILDRIFSRFCVGK